MAKSNKEFMQAYGAGPIKVANYLAQASAPLDPTITCPICGATDHEYTTILDMVTLTCPKIEEGMPKVFPLPTDKEV